MTHELKNIFIAHKDAQRLGIQTALVTVVALNGSSYRKPGVRMLVTSNGEITGAVSGGCVEKEIVRQSQSVFQSNQPLIMTYDGRYRIGCEGLLYILIEPFNPADVFFKAFDTSVKNRLPLEINAYYHSEKGNFSDIGSTFIIDQQMFKVSDFSINEQTECFQHILPPCFRLYILGTEHDAVELCRISAHCGWEIEVIASYQSLKSIAQFPGATNFHHINAEELNQLPFDSQTVVVLMTHNFAKDLNYLIQLAQHSAPTYIGILGSTLRMEQLMTSILERNSDISTDFMDLIHGPAGLDIHAITPQEIAISILAQIISLTRNKVSEPTPTLIADQIL
jgi:xanthine/CO dehydrogenase XdhC/CoxF family maturation factor